MVALSRFKTASSPCPSCLAASLTSLMYSSMSSVDGSNEKVHHLSCRCLIFLPCVEKYLLKCVVNLCQFPRKSFKFKPWYHSRAKCCKVCLKLSMKSSGPIHIASIQSDAANKCASGLSPGNPLKTGGGILTLGLLLSSSGNGSSP